MGSEISKQPRSIAKTWNDALYIRSAAAVVCASVLTFYASRIYLTEKMALGLRIGAILAIALVGIAGIASLLQNDEEDGPPPERLYTADEVAALLAAVQAGTLVPATPPACKFCGLPGAEGTGPGGDRYHRACMQRAYATGKT
jgi:hypothetical protein